MTNRESYRSSHTSKGYGEFYDETIFNGYFGDLWRRVEQPLLCRWLASARERGASTAIDFACGTGRIAEVVGRYIPEVVGVDVSSEMLAQARKRCPEVRFVERDLTGGDLSNLPRADVITVFRFFQNAEPTLRHEVLDVLARLLADDGELIVNVQCNGEGPMGIVTRVRRKFLRHDVHTLSHGDTVEMLGEHGFTVVETVWYGYWPRLGPLFSGLANRMQKPAEKTVARLGIPARRASQMFAVRARRCAN